MKKARPPLDEGHSFLIRVGANVRLLKNLGTARQHGGLVDLWSNGAARKKQPPIILRLLEFQGPRGKVYLVTNVLSKGEWSLVGLTLVQLFAVKEQIKIGSPPAQSSVALALSAIQGAMRNWSRTINDPQELVRRLRAATKDKYRRTRSKQARYRPRNKDQPTAAKPIITAATPQQRRAYQAFLANAA